MNIFQLSLGRRGVGIGQSRIAEILLIDKVTSSYKYKGNASSYSGSDL